MLVLFFNFLLTLLLLLALLSLLASIVKGAPFVPSKKKALGAILFLTNPQSGERIADLGSGDGRILIALAKAGAEAHGFEINPFLVLWSYLKIHREGLFGKIFVHWKSFWHSDLSSFDKIVVYGTVYIMADLERKLKDELKPGSRVISNTFKFPSWSPLRSEERVYLYSVPNGSRAIMTENEGFRD